MLVAGTTHFSATCSNVNIEVAGNQENRKAGEQRSHTNLFNIARPTHTSWGNNFRVSWKLQTTICYDPNPSPSSICCSVEILTGRSNEGSLRITSYTFTLESISHSPYTPSTFLDKTTHFSQLPALLSIPRPATPTSLRTTEDGSGRLDNLSEAVVS